MHIIFQFSPWPDAPMRRRARRPPGSCGAARQTAARLPLAHSTRKLEGAPVVRGSQRGIRASSAPVSSSNFNFSKVIPFYGPAAAADTTRYSDSLESWNGQAFVPRRRASCNHNLWFSRLFRRGAGSGSRWAVGVHRETDSVVADRITRHEAGNGGAGTRGEGRAGTGRRDPGASRTGECHGHAAGDAGDTPGLRAGGGTAGFHPGFRRAGSHGTAGGAQAAARHVQTG